MEDFHSIIQDFEYKDWSITIVEYDNSFIMHLEPSSAIEKHLVPASFTKWYIDPDISFQDLSNLIFVGIFTVEKHLLSQQFSYKNATVFCPHKEKDRYIKIENRILDPRKAKQIECFDDLVAIVRHIFYNNWIFEVFEDRGIPFLRIKFEETDTITKEISYQYSRKWVFNYNEMGETQVIQTCFLAASTALRHECRERFLYKKKWIANPHRSIKMILEESTK